MAWSVLQSNSAGLDPGAAAVTYLSNVSAGTKLIAFICTSGGSNPQVTAVKDAALNSMTKLGSAFCNNAAANGELSIWAMDTPAGDVGAKPTLTATQTGGNQSFGMVIQEVSGLLAGNTTAMLDGSAAASTGSISANGPIACGAYSSAAVNEYLVAVGGDSENSTLTWAAPTGSTTYTRDAHARNATVIFNCVPSYGNSTGGAETASSAITGAGTATPWATLFVAFKLAPVAAAGGTGAAQPGQTWLRRFHHRQFLPPPAGAVTVDSTGSSPAGAGAVSAVVTQIAPASAAGAGSVTAAATVIAGASAAGAAAASAKVTQQVIATATGAGSVTDAVTQIATAVSAGAGAVSDVVTQIATATAAGAGSVTAAGAVSGSSTASVAGAGSVTAIVTQIAPAAAAPAAAVTAAATQAATATAAGAGAAGPAPVTQIAPASAAGAAAVTDAVTQIAIATAAGAGSVTAAGSVTGAGATASAAGAAAVTALATQIAPAAAAGAGSVTDVATQIAKATAAGASSATAAGYIAGTANVAGAGSATAKAAQIAPAAAAGAAVLSALATQIALAAISGAGSATAAGSLQLAFTVGTLTATDKPGSVLTAAGAANGLTASTAAQSTLTAGDQRTGGPG